jgi:hypothetical protein
MPLISLFPIFLSVSQKSRALQSKAVHLFCQLLHVLRLSSLKTGNPELAVESLVLEKGIIGELQGIVSEELQNTVSREWDFMEDGFTPSPVGTIGKIKDFERVVFILCAGRYPQIQEEYYQALLPNLRDDEGRLIPKKHDEIDLDFFIKKLEKTIEVRREKELEDNMQAEIGNPNALSLKIGGYFRENQKENAPSVELKSHNANQKSVFSNLSKTERLSKEDQLVSTAVTSKIASSHPRIHFRATSSKSFEPININSFDGKELTSQINSDSRRNVLIRSSTKTGFHTLNNSQAANQKSQPDFKLQWLNGAVVKIDTKLQKHLSKLHRGAAKPSITAPQCRFSVT